MCRPIRNMQRDWGFPKSDREAPYKQLRANPDKSQYAAKAHKPPKDGRRYGPLGNSMMFGPIASVAHYNVISRTICDVVNRTLGAP